MRKKQLVSMLCPWMRQLIQYTSIFKRLTGVEKTAPNKKAAKGFEKQLWYPTMTPRHCNYETKTFLRQITVNKVLPYQENQLF